MNSVFYSTITADSYPVFGNIISFSAYWSSEDWIYWYGLMKNYYSKSYAQQKFIQAWNDSPFAAKNIDWRSTDLLFIDFAKSEGLYEALFTGVIGAVVETADVGVSAIKEIPSIAQNLLNVVSWIGNNIGLILLMVLLFGGFIAYLRYGKK